MVEAETNCETPSAANRAGSTRWLRFFWLRRVVETPLRRWALGLVVLGVALAIASHWVLGPQYDLNGWGSYTSGAGERPPMFTVERYFVAVPTVVSYIVVAFAAMVGRPWWRASSRRKRIRALALTPLVALTGRRQLSWPVALTRAFRYRRRRVASRKMLPVASAGDSRQREKTSQHVNPERID